MADSQNPAPDAEYPEPDNPTPGEQTPPTPEELLQELSAELQQHESDISRLTKERDDLKGKVETLSKTVEEIKKASAGFGQAGPGLDEEVRKIKEHYQAEVKGVEAVLGEKKQQVVSEVKKVDDRIKSQRERVGVLQGQASKAAGEYEAARARADQKQKAYDALKSLPKTLAENVKKLKDLENKIEAFDRQTKPASEYALLLEQKKLLDETEVPSEAAYKERLNAAGQELDDARVSARDQKRAAEAAAADLSNEQAKLKALEDGRVADILKEVDKLN